MAPETESPGAPEAAAPPPSAAEALAATPFFCELSAVDLARLVPDLEELRFPAGAAVFRQGDPADGLYLIRSGAVELAVAEAGGAGAVMALRAPAHFGEGALLEDAPRSATAVAAAPLVAWRLPRARFEALLRERPGLAVAVAAELARRLNEANRRLAAGQRQVAVVARAAYGTLDPAAQALLRRVAVFGRFDPALLAAALGPDWAAAPFAELAEEAAFFRPAEPEGWHAFLQESVRTVLLRQLRSELGPAGVDALRRRGAEALLARPDADPADAMDLLQEAGDWPRLADALQARGGEVAGRDPVRLEGYLRALPPRVLRRRPGLVGLLADSCARQGRPEQAIAAYEEAGRRGAARSPGVARAHQEALAALYREVGDHEASLACLRRAAELGGDAGPCGESGPASLTAVPGVPPAPPAATDRPGWGRRDARAALARLREREVSARPLLAAAVVASAALAWALPPPAGLPPEGLRVLAGVGALVALGFLGVLPNHLLGLLLVAAWAATGTLPPEVAASGFASPAWFLLLASTAVGAAVARSGLLYRGAVELVRRLPPSHAARCAALGALGALASPGLPDPAGRVMLAAPLAQDVADTLRYPERSGGSAGLALATFVGFGMMGPLFMTGSTGGLIAYGLLPPDARAQVDWVRWFVAALPPMLVLLALTTGFLVWRYRPDGPDGRPEATLALQRRVLGPTTRDERGVLAVLGALVLGFSTQSLHGVAPAWVAAGAVAALYLLGALDDGAFRAGANLPFLLYVGVVLGFGPAFARAGVDAWLAETLSGLAAPVARHPAAFLLAVAAMAALLGAALRPSPVALLLGVALLPTAAAAGVAPWAVMFTAMVANNLWLYPQQNVLYEAAHGATGGRAFGHRQARPLAFAYAAFVLVAVAAAVPWWRWLGLVG